MNTSLTSAKPSRGKDLTAVARVYLVLLTTFSASAQHAPSLKATDDFLQRTVQGSKVISQRDSTSNPFFWVYSYETFSLSGCSANVVERYGFGGSDILSRTPRYSKSYKFNLKDINLGDVKVTVADENTHASFLDVGLITTANFIHLDSDTGQTTEENANKVRLLLEATLVDRVKIAMLHGAKLCSAHKDVF
jgi:hypothetical protein